MPDFPLENDRIGRKDRVAYNPLAGRIAFLGAVAFFFGALGFFLYRDVILHSPFLFDDFEYIAGNPMIKGFSYFTNISDPRYLGYLSIAVNYWLGGEDPFGFHLVNVVVHVMNALLAFCVVKEVLALSSSAGDRTSNGHWAVGFFAALVFLVHPVETRPSLILPSASRPSARFFIC